MLLGAYFYGYMITSLPGGMLAENFGGKPVAGYSCLIAGVLTALTPLAASWSKWAVWILRFGVGFFTVSSIQKYFNSKTITYVFIIIIFIYFKIFY